MSVAGAVGTVLDEDREYLMTLVPDANEDQVNRELRYALEDGNCESREARLNR